MKEFEVISEPLIVQKINNDFDQYGQFLLCSAHNTILNQFTVYRESKQFRALSLSKTNIFFQLHSFPKYTKFTLLSVVMFVFLR